MSGTQPFAASIIGYIGNIQTGLGYHWDTIAEGGRASRALFLKHAEAINKFIGADVADKMHPGKTLIVQD